MNRVFKNASIAAKLAGLTDRVSKIVKSPNKEEYCVKSESNPDWSGGCYPSKAKAESRLKDVEAFKHMKKQSSDSAPAIPRVEQVLLALKSYIDNKDSRKSINALRNIALNMADLVDENNEPVVDSLIEKLTSLGVRMTEISRIQDIITFPKLKKLIEKLVSAAKGADSEELRMIVQFIRDALQSARMAALKNIAQKIVGGLPKIAV
jgi:hypothetical protein